MTLFETKFGADIRHFYKMPDEQETSLLAAILQYANSNPQSFREEIAEIMFNQEIEPLPVVFESLSKDTANWGQWYADTVDRILGKAAQVNEPQEILSNLSELFYILEDEHPFVQRIVDRLYKEIDSDILSIKLTAIWTLPAFLSNPCIQNKECITAALQQKLNDPSWKVRNVTFRSLRYENLLPEGETLSLKDKILKLLLGEPHLV